MNSFQTSQVLDLNRLGTSTMGDAALQREVIDMFMAQISDVLRQLKMGEHVEWQFVAHTLRGTAAAVGACEIAALATAWESAPQAEVDGVLARLNAAAIRFEDAVEPLFSDAA